MSNMTFMVLNTWREDELRAFYKILGLTLIEEKHGEGPVHHSMTDGRGLIIEFYHGAPMDAAHGARYGFEVESLEETVKSFLALDEDWHYRIKGPFDNGTRYVVQDPDDRTLHLTQKRL